MNDVRSNGQSEYRKKHYKRTKLNQHKSGLSPEWLVFPSPYIKYKTYSMWIVHKSTQSIRKGNRTAKHHNVDEQINNTEKQNLNMIYKKRSNIIWCLVGIRC